MKPANEPPKQGEILIKYLEIDQIIKEDILELISLAFLSKDGTTFERDGFSEEMLQPGVHKIEMATLILKKVKKCSFFSLTSIATCRIMTLKLSVATLKFVFSVTV